jgi:copper chaperone CopZ
MEKLSYIVPGMNCDYCAKAVNLRVRRLPGVGLISADARTSSVVVTGYFLDERAVSAAIEAVATQCGHEHDGVPDGP